MKTLDGVTRKLTTDTIVLEDEKNGIFDLCGVMGGENSGIMEKTHSILLHGMSYDPIRIRRTALKVGPRTDASAIFEKTVPYSTVKQAMLRSIKLILQIFPEAKIVSSLLDQKNYTEKQVCLNLDPMLVERVVGAHIDTKEMKRILELLGCTVDMKAKKMSVTVPPWRFRDISIPEDLAEEIVRIHGLHTVKESQPQIQMQSFAPAAHRTLEQNIAGILVKNGCYEVLTLAFLGEQLLSRAGFEKNATMITLKNPLSEDLSIMRTSLTPRLLETAERNIRHRKTFRIFESGNVFQMRDGGKTETLRITGLLVGEDFFAAKAIAEEICSVYDWKYRIGDWTDAPAFVHPGRNGVLRIGKNGFIKICELHPHIAKEFDLPVPCSMLCLDIEMLANIPLTVKKIWPLPRFQEIPFDVSVLCDRKISVGNLVQGLEKLDKRIRACDIVDVFEGKDVPEGQKSVTLSFEFRAPDRTLTEDERDELWKLLMKELEKRGAAFRFAS
jgi:phenylalanyl-tRNA synthetase beta chain